MLMKYLLTSALTLLLAANGFAADSVPWSQDFTDYSSNVYGWKNDKIQSRGNAFRISSGELTVNSANRTYPNESIVFFSADGFDLTAGKDYRFDIDAMSNYADPTGTNRTFEIRLYKKGADKPVYSDEHTVLLEMKNEPVEAKAYKTYSTYFNVPTTGEYYLALHMTSTSTAGGQYYDNFRLIEQSMDAPGKGVISATADPNGLHKAAVTYTVPTTSIRGNALSSVTKVELYRDGGVANTWESPTPGATLTFNDQLAQPGTHRYGAIAYNDKGAGANIEYDVTVGNTIADAKYLYKAIYTADGKVRIEWPAAAEGTVYQVQAPGGRVLTGTATASEDGTTMSLTDDAFTLGTEPTGWQYNVYSVADDNSTSLLGATNYLCLNNEIPYYPVMNNDKSLTAFTLDQDRQYGWQYYGANGGHVGVSISREYGTNRQYKDWLISPGLLLKKDKFYRVKLNGCSSNGAVKYTIKAGKSNTNEALDIMVAEDRPLPAGGMDMNLTVTDESFLSVPEDGMYFVGIIGNLPETVSSDYLRIKRFDIIEVDATLPSFPTDVTIHYSATGGSDGKVSFKLPTKSISGTDLTSFTKVEILKDGEPFKTITENLTPGAELSFDVEIVAGSQNVYTILPFNAAGQGESAAAKVLVLTAPYSNDFGTKSSLEGFTTINNTGSTNNIDLQSNMVRIYPNELGNDHWLITPPVTLSANMFYDLSFIAKAGGDEGGKLDVYLGKAADPELLMSDESTAVLKDITLDKANNIFAGLREEYITVAENGQYFLGFHFTREPGNRSGSEVFLDDLTISSAIAGTAPDRGVLEVIPAADGSLKAELNFTVPTKSLNGADLNANSTQSCMFFINGVQTPSNRNFSGYPGQKIAITVDVEQDLPYIFSARAGWNGRMTYQDAFVGINRPAYPDPDKIELTETLPYGTIVMEWEAPTKDVEGYPLNPELLTYDISRFDVSIQTGQPYETPILKDFKGTKAEFKAMESTGAQKMMRFVIRARNSKGDGSSGVITPYINVGRPYRMPYKESFVTEQGYPGAATAIFDEAVEGMCRWGIMTDGIDGFKSADNDGAYIALESPYIGSTGRLYTGKVNLGNSESPCMTLMVYNPSPDGSNPSKNTLEFKVFSYLDNKWHSLGEPRSIEDLTEGKAGWNKITVDLTDFTDNVVTCAIEATCNNYKFTSIDNINIREIPANDLSIQSYAVPVSVVPGEKFTATLNISNNGKTDATPESVEMYVDGELARTAEVAAIETGKTSAFTIEHSFPSVDMATEHLLSFKVNYEADEEPADNEVNDIAILTVAGNLPAVTNVEGTADDDMFVTLKWDAPEVAEGGVKTESFEDWKPGVASQNGWTAYDADGRNILGINDGTGNAIVIPGLTSNEPASWAVIDNAESALPASRFPAKTGSKFLMSINPAGGTGSANDWFISPELSGKAQTVKMFMRNFPNYRAGYEVLYSDGPMFTDKFTAVDRDAVNTNGDWAEFSFDLPEGTKRMAVRNISFCEDGFMLMLDDITYEAAGRESTELLGYNIYQEAEVIAQPETAAYKSPTALPEGTYTYGITARYAKGESPMTAVDVTVSAKSGISTAAAEGVHVFGGEGCINILGAEGMEVTVCDLSGRIMAGGTMGTETRIAAAQGIYIVTVGETSYKVMVK